MMNWLLPPVAKIYEAISVLSDNRFEIKESGIASVTSSSGEKQYTISWKEDQDKISITSNDNASRWQGYTGYPIISVLMIIGKIKYDERILPYFKGINWHSLNKSFKNDYDRAVDSILSRIDQQQAEQIRTEADNIYHQLASLKLVRFSQQK